MTAQQTCSCGEASHDEVVVDPPMTVYGDGESDVLNADDAEALAAVWTVLARVLAAPPGPEALDNLRSAELLQEWPLLGGEQPVPDALANGLEELATSRRVGEDASVVADDLMRLLRGPGSAIAYPYESVHRSREGLVFDQETMQVRGWYARFGLEAPQLNRDPDDHIHLELEFCATLLRRGLDALDRDDDVKSQRFFAAHQGFCREHLLTWASAFFDQLLQGANTHFYRGMAALGRHAVGRAGDLT